MRYAGPPQLTLARAFTQWTADVPVIIVVLAALAAYLYGVRVARRAGHPWATGRTVAFCGLGLGFLVLATMSWIGAYQDVLFYARATQTVLLVLVVPLFCAMGKPLTLLSLAAPRAAGPVLRVVRSRVAVAVTFPAVTTLALVAVPFTMYFTGWYAATFTSGALREVTYLALMTPGYLYFWTLLHVDPVPRQYNRAISMWITAAEVVADAFFGIAVIADQNLIALHHYQGLHRPFGPSFATDQVIGGGVLWILGDFVGLPFLAVLLIQAMREDRAAAIAIDAELDAREAAVRSAREAQADDDPVLLADPELPWWHHDPRFTDRFKQT